jgi:hypothetical protein
MVDVDRNLHRLPLLRRCSSSLAARGMDGVRRWGALGGEERHPGEGFGQSSGFYTPVVDSVRRGFDRLGLGSWAVLSGRRSELRARVGSVWSGV